MARPAALARNERRGCSGRSSSSTPGYPDGVSDPDDLERWLTEGDAPEADWATYVLRRALRGELGDGGPGILLDLVALMQPYGCRTELCTPGMRGPRDRSCCADLEVAVTPREAEAITDALPEIATLFTEDPRWSAGVPAVIEDGALRRQGRRCIFARLGPKGLSCGLHALEDQTARPRGTLKPVPCRLFPLAVVDLADGRMLLTAIHRNTSTFLASRPARAFPCLGAGGTPLYISEEAAITELFGRKVYKRLVVAAKS